MQVNHKSQATYTTSFRQPAANQLEHHMDPKNSTRTLIVHPKDETLLGKNRGLLNALQLIQNHCERYAGSSRCCLGALWLFVGCLKTPRCFLKPFPMFSMCFQGVFRGVFWMPSGGSLRASEYLARVSCLKNLPWAGPVFRVAFCQFGSPSPE